VVVQKYDLQLVLRNKRPKPRTRTRAAKDSWTVPCRKDSPRDLSDGRCSSSLAIGARAHPRARYCGTIAGGVRGRLVTMWATCVRAACAAGGGLCYADPCPRSDFATNAQRTAVGDRTKAEKHASRAYQPQPRNPAAHQVQDGSSSLFLVF
jgi:hypothetical protein